MISDYIEELYDRALDAEIEPSLFWNSSIGEVHDLIQAFHKRKKNEFKQTLSLMELQIDLTAQRMVKILGNKEVEITSIFDLAPDLFETEIAEKEKEKQMAESIAYTEKFKKYAKQHNKRFKEVAKQ